MWPSAVSQVVKVGSRPNVTELGLTCTKEMKMVLLGITPYGQALMYQDPMASTQAGRQLSTQGWMLCHVLLIHVSIGMMMGITTVAVPLQFASDV